jgi:hypothetical protein
MKHFASANKNAGPLFKPSQLTGKFEVRSVASGVMRIPLHSAYASLPSGAASGAVTLSAAQSGQERGRGVGRKGSAHSASVKAAACSKIQKWSQTVTNDGAK